MCVSKEEDRCAGRTDMNPGSRWVAWHHTVFQAYAPGNGNRQNFYRWRARNCLFLVLSSAYNYDLCHKLLEDKKRGSRGRILASCLFAAQYKRWPKHSEAGRRGFCLSLIFCYIFNTQDITQMISTHIAEIYKNINKKIQLISRINCEQLLCLLAKLIWPAVEMHYGGMGLCEVSCHVDNNTKTRSNQIFCVTKFQMFRWEKVED